MSDRARSRLRHVLLVLLAPACAALWSAAAFAEPVVCRDVLAELNRRVSRGMGRQVERIAKSLDADAVWVERCLRTHGRRVEHTDEFNRPEVEPTELVEPVFDPNDFEPDLEPRRRRRR